MVTVSTKNHLGIVTQFNTYHRNTVIHESVLLQTLRDFLLLNVNRTRGLDDEEDNEDDEENSDFEDKNKVCQDRDHVHLCIKTLSIFTQYEFRKLFTFYPKFAF